MRGVGKESGLDVYLEATNIWTLRDGLVIREEHHRGHDAVDIAAWSAPR